MQQVITIILFKKAVKYLIQRITVLW